MDAITELEMLRRSQRPTQRALGWVPDANPYAGLTPSRRVNQALGRSWGGMRLGDAIPIVSEVPEGQARWETLTRPRESWQDYAVLPAEVLGAVGIGPRGPKQASRRDIFAGAGAATADRAALERAQQMASQGVDAGKIWEDTGWWVPTEDGPIPPGGAPRFEIPDPLPNVPVKRTTAAGAEAGADYAHRAKVLESAAALKEFAEKHKLDIPEAISKMRELGLETPPKEAVQHLMMPVGARQTPVSMMERAHLYKQMAERESMGQGTLGERYPHPELYEAYPKMRNYKVELVDPDRLGGASGEFDPVRKKIRIDQTLPEDRVASTLLHEVQHAIQDRERGFSLGGNPETAGNRVSAATSAAVVDRTRLKRSIEAMEETIKSPDLSEAQVARLRRDLEHSRKALAELERIKPAPGARQAWEGMTPYDQYRHLGGEAEARLVQNRQHLRGPNAMPEQRRKVYPWTQIGGLDVPLEYIIP